MSTESESLDRTTAAITFTAVAIPIALYIISRRQILEKWPMFAKLVRAAWSAFFHCSQLTKV